MCVDSTCTLPLIYTQMKTFKLLALLGVLSTLVCCGGKSESGEKPDTDYTLACTPETIVVGSDGGTVTLNVSADHDWTVFTEEGWITCKQTGSTAPGGTVAVTVAANREDTAREGSVTLKSGSIRKTVPVTQKEPEVAISDVAFRKYLLDNFDADGDGALTSRELAAASELNISGLGIVALPELNSVFKHVTRLDCSNNSLKELNISELTQLVYLDCSNNELSTLDIQNQQRLNYFNAAGNDALTEIYVWAGFTEKSGFTKPDGAVYVEPEMNIPAGYRLVWNDEFNSEGEASPSSQWWYETGDGGWGNHELQDYVSGGKYNGERLALVSDGTLKIIAKKIDGKVRSVRMNTNESWTYGYFEARLKLPSGKGTWPAFWMMPKNFKAWPDDGEIDIMEEVGYHANYVSSSIHCKAYYHSIGTQKTHEMYLAGAQDDFHTYALEWTPDVMYFYVDGNRHFTFTNEHNGKDTWPFDAPFYLKLNLAWGGDWGGAQGVDESCLPAVYEIDYVRVFQKLE